MPLPRRRSSSIISVLAVVVFAGAACGGSDVAETAGQLNSETLPSTTLAVDSTELELELDLEPLEELEAADFGADDEEVEETTTTTEAPAVSSGSGVATTSGATRAEIEAALVEAHGPTTDLVSDVRLITFFPDGLPTPDGASIRTARARTRVSDSSLAVELFVSFPGDMNTAAALIDQSMSAAGYESDSTSITDAGDSDRIDLTYENVTAPEGSGTLKVAVISDDRGQELWIRWNASNMDDNGFDRLSGWIGDDLVILPAGSELTAAGIGTTGSANSGALFSAEFRTGTDITTNDALEAALVANAEAAGMTVVAGPDELRSNVAQFSTSQFEKFEFTVGDDTGMITASTTLPPLF